MRAAINIRIGTGSTPMNRVIVGTSGSWSACDRRVRTAPDDRLGRATTDGVVGVAAAPGRNSVVENGSVLTMRVRVLRRWRVARWDRRAGRRLLGAVGVLVVSAVAVGVVAVGAVAVGVLAVRAVVVGALDGAAVGALDVRLPVPWTDPGREARASASWEDARAAARRTDCSCPEFWCWLCSRTWL